MTTIAPGLTVRDSQILELLRGGATPQRVTEIGVYRRSWTGAHVRRVMDRHTPPKAQPRPKPAAVTGTWRPPTFDVTDPPVANLTTMQGQVLTCICMGLSNRGVADQLHIAEDTAKTHAKAVLAALHADDRLHAAVLALTGQVRVVIRTTQQKRKEAR